VREAVGPDYLFGVRLSAKDHNQRPLNLRWPPWPLRHWWMGNGIEDTIWFAKELEGLGVDYLHVTNGFGFINPKEGPGSFPVPEVRRLYNSNRHLSFKAWLRAALVNAIPELLLSLVFGLGWTTKSSGENIRMAAAIKGAVGIPVIANGGFQSRALAEEALSSGACDMVSMARPLLANPDLLEIWKTADEPERPCTFCSRCCVATATAPVGCYEPKRFGSRDEMEAQILSWLTDPDVEPPLIAG
jgi:2,4-dienoyl-CoA reductase-like NADH-dependent reductase (Old Yellow Enzyme family)